MMDLFKLMTEKPLTFEKDWVDFRLFAIKHHGSQLYGKYPYAYHLASVEAYLSEFGFNEHHYQASAWLHDILEDTSVDIDNLNAHYGPVITGIVWSCTGEGANRKERNQTIYTRLQKYPLAAPVKVADRLTNTIEANRLKDGNKKLNMYLDEWPEFKANLKPLMEDSRSFQLFDRLCSTVDNIKDKNGK